MMTVLAGLLAQVLHIALIVAAAPSLAGLHRWMLARLAGRTGPPLAQPWLDLVRLARKQTVLAESASEVSRMAPLAAGAATLVAGCMVPSFGIGMAVGPAADLLLVGGLLAVAQGAEALAAMDAGTALAGLAASRTMLVEAAIQPALFLVVFVLALLAGSLNLDLVAAMQMEGGDWRSGIALAAMLLVAIAGTRREAPMASDLSGPTLALAEATGALRLLIWFNLIGTLFLPFGMAHADEGPLAWIVGIACWLGRTVALTAALAVLQTLRGTFGVRHAWCALGAAAVLGLLAAVAAFAGMGTA
jgi:formate hydrogenlyase subunit 4